MTPKEIYDLTRKNFKIKTEKYFDFLIKEFDFEIPIYSYSEQSNGVVFADKFEYLKVDKKSKIVISNSYHPVDYGFEINYIDLKTGLEKLLENVTKEEQSYEQDYLKTASENLKKRLNQIYS